MHRDQLKGHVFTKVEATELVAYVNEHRTHDRPFDVCISGMTKDADDTRLIADYAAAGATWWQEGFVPWASTFEDVKIRLRNGPPRVS